MGLTKFHKYIRIFLVDKMIITYYNLFTMQRRIVMTTERSPFSVRLEELLDARKMTQKELAAKSGVTEAAMSHYVKGDRTPRSAVLSRIAMALNTTSDYLMEGIPQDYINELGYAKRLIARNVDQMTNAEKKEILSILLGKED